MDSLAVLHKVDLYIHLLRGFDDDLSHYEETIDPLRDLETYEQEIMKKVYLSIYIDPLPLDLSSYMFTLSFNNNNNNNNNN